MQPLTLKHPSFLIHVFNGKQTGKGYHPGALRAAEAFGLHLTNVAGAS